MAIKFVSLKDVSVATDDKGVKTITGIRDEQTFFGTVRDIALMPTKISDDESFVSASAAAQSSIAWGVVGFHIADYMHARKDRESAKSPVTKLFIGQ